MIVNTRALLIHEHIWGKVAELAKLRNILKLLFLCVYHLTVLEVGFSHAMGIGTNSAQC